MAYVSKQYYFQLTKILDEEHHPHTSLLYWFVHSGLIAGFDRRDSTSSNAILLNDNIVRPDLFAIHSYWQLIS